MTEKEIKNLKKGDVICYPHPDRDYMVYGLIEDDGSLFCTHILGDGDSNIGKDDIFYYSEPGWLDSYNVVFKATNDEAHLFRCLCKHYNIKDNDNDD